MTTIIDHPEDFTTGTRVLYLTGRYKDNVSKRNIFRVSNNSDKFQEMLMELASLARQGERIYASASERNVKRAACEFKHRQVDAESEPNPYSFYEHLNSRWISCLMDPRCQFPKKWLFDCDTIEQYASVLRWFEEMEKPVEYQYKTKNGYHIIQTPFDTRNGPPELTHCRHDNPLMLWMY